MHSRCCVMSYGIWFHPIWSSLRNRQMCASATIMNRPVIALILLLAIAYCIITYGNVSMCYRSLKRRAMSGDKHFQWHKRQSSTTLMDIICLFIYYFVSSIRCCATTNNCIQSNYRINKMQLLLSKGTMCGYMHCKLVTSNQQQPLVHSAHFRNWT